MNTPIKQYARNNPDISDALFSTNKFLFQAKCDNKEIFFQNAFLKHKI